MLPQDERQEQIISCRRAAAPESTGQGVRSAVGCTSIGLTDGAVQAVAAARAGGRAAAIGSPPVKSVSAECGGADDAK